MTTENQVAEEKFLESEQVFDYYCQPCSDSSKHLEAQGYCSNCEEYLCKKCFDCHKIPTAMRDHLLLDKSEMMQKKPPTTTKDKSTRKCPRHEDKTIEYFCETHNCLGCGACVALDHRENCQVLYIPNVSRGIAHKPEYETFITKVSQIEHDSEELIKRAKTNMDLAEDSYQDILEGVKETREKINKILDELENKVKGEAEELKQKQVSKMKEVSEKCAVNLAALKEVMYQIERLQTYHLDCNTYIMMKQTDEQLHTMGDRIQNAKIDVEIDINMFESNTEFIEMLEKEEELGKLVLALKEAEFLSEINVKSKKDAFLCWVTGSTVLPKNQLALTDYENDKLKILDTKRNKITSELPFSSGPWAITTVEEDQVAVTLPDEQTVILAQTNPSLALYKSLKVNGTCFGIAYHDGKLVVTFKNPDKVDIIKLSGTVIKSISTGDAGQKLFNAPSYVSINAQSKVMYVSNWADHSVVCLRLDGCVVATYKDASLINPAGTAIDINGMVYVCGGAHTVHQLSRKCKNIKLVLLGSGDGLKFPTALCYDMAENKIYVSCEQENKLKVYRLTDGSQVKTNFSFFGSRFR